MKDKLIWRAECFEAYGLNKYRNFMNEYQLKLTTNDELFDFARMALNEHGCENSAVFMIDYHGGMWVGINIPENDEEMELYGCKDFDVEYFAQIDGECRFCCYALMIEVRPNVWKIIND